MIHDAKVEECASCSRRFDMRFPERMRSRQKQHRREQLHLFGPCGFLRHQYYDRGMHTELYDTPWEDKGRLLYFHSDECEQAYTNSGDFDYWTCDQCERQVCTQNPRNGWMWQYRNHADLGEICLRCYEKVILENGQPRIDFEGNKIAGGMFFSGDNREPLNAGFEEVDGFYNYFVQDGAAAKRYNRKALELIDASYKVITAYERLAIGGLEGYITMLATLKPASSPGR